MSLRDWIIIGAIAVFVALDARGSEYLGAWGEVLGQRVRPATLAHCTIAKPEIVINQKTSITDRWTAHCYRRKS